MSSTGTTTFSSRRLAAGGCTTVTWRGPPRNPATSPTGRTVADSPIRWAGPVATVPDLSPAAPGPPIRSASSRSSETARCAPRLLPARACTSSTITVSTPRSDSRALEVSSRNSDSGVVISTSGGLLASLRRSSAAVSPVRTATWISGSSRPRLRAACRIPVSGARRFRSMSVASAFSGEMYSTRQRRLGSAGAGAAASRSSAHKKAASVLPDPVGAMTSVSSPLPIAVQAWAWAGVGSAKTAVNQALVAGEKFSSDSVVTWLSGMFPSCPAPLTFLSARDPSQLSP